MPGGLGITKQTVNFLHVGALCLVDFNIEVIQNCIITTQIFSLKKV
jgi:enhancing lycopene biosynthesis protein 2